MIETAKVDCSGFPVVESGSLAGGTGIKQAIREARDCRWMEYSEMGPSGVCMLTARPLKHGMTVGGVDRRILVLLQLRHPGNVYETLKRGRKVGDEVNRALVRNVGGGLWRRSG